MIEGIIGFVCGGCCGVFFLVFLALLLYVRDYVQAGKEEAEVERKTYDEVIREHIEKNVIEPEEGWVKK